MQGNQDQKIPKPLSKRKYYLINLLLFLYLLLDYSIFIYVAFFWKVSLTVKFLICIPMSMTMPDLSIFDSYNTYLKSFAKGFGKINNLDNGLDKVKAPTFRDRGFLIFRLIDKLSEYIKRKKKKLYKS